MGEVLMSWAVLLAWLVITGLAVWAGWVILEAVRAYGWWGTLDRVLDYEPPWAGTQLWRHEDDCPMPSGVLPCPHCDGGRRTR